MACINISSVSVQSNPASFSDPLAFEVCYECTQELQADLEWKMVYIGSAESEKYDQVLDSILVGPVYAGQYSFVFEGNAPDPTKLQPEDVVGSTAILITVSYKEKEFIRIGYFVENYYEEEALRENPPAQPDIARLRRSICDDPRVTRFPHDFDSPPMEEPASGGAMDVNMQGDADMGTEGPSSTTMGDMGIGQQGGGIVWGAGSGGMEGEVGGGMAMASGMHADEGGMQQHQYGGYGSMHEVMS